MLNFSNFSVIYISQKNGKNDYTGFTPEADGFGGGPVATIECALDKICHLRVSGNFRPLKVCFTDEEYFLENTIELVNDKMKKIFRNNDCFTGITFEGLSHNTKLVGGSRLSGFKKDSFNGQDCFSVYIPEVKEGRWDFTDLYVDGKRAKLTRYPSEGTLRCIDTEHNEGELFTPSGWFIAKKDDLKDISGIEDAIVSYYHYWVDEHSPVKSYDRETGKLEMEYRSRFLITNKYDEPHNAANLEYYLENIPEQFKNPGEWYLEKATGMLYYIPENEEQTEDNICVYAPRFKRLVDVCGNEEFLVSNIHFKNLEFVCSKGDYASSADVTGKADGEVFGADAQSVANAYGAINFKNARNCSIKRCNINNLGVHGVSIESGCSDIKIEECNIFDMGAGGVRIFGGVYGCEPTDETHHISVKNCSISYCGRRYAAGCGILASHTYSCEFSGNEISYLDYSGISVGWVWGYANSITHDNLIHNNHIHHIGMGNLSDMGGIYLLGKQRGTVVSENHIHDVICSHYGGWGIYTDEGSSFITIERNKVYNTSSNCFHQHYGSDNVVRDNIFAYGGDAVIRCSIPENHSCLVMENNVFITEGKPIFATYNEETGLNPGVMSRKNTVYDTTGNEPCIFLLEGRRVSLSEGQGMGYEQETVFCGAKIPEELKIK